MGLIFSSSCTAVVGGRHKAWQWRCSKSNTRISFSVLTSVTWPHMVGRYCCWLVNEGILYTDIYVLLEERHAFFAIEHNHMFWHFSAFLSPSFPPKISQSNRCFELANMVANTSHARHWAESKHCPSSEDSLY